MRTHEQMPLVDAFGRSIVIIDREEHARIWCCERRKEYEARMQAVREELHALKLFKRDFEQLEDELARMRRAS